MALSPAEKSRRWREREKQKRQDALKKGATPALATFRTPFYELFGGSGHDLDFELALALAGIPAPEFEDDSGPEVFALRDATVGVDDPFGGAKGALGRAEVMVGCLIDAAVSLAALVNEYKRTEIRTRIREIEESDLSDPQVRRAAFKEVTRLNKMLDQLSKQVRWTFPQWKEPG